MAGHVAGEDFIMLDARSVKPIMLPVELLGAMVIVTAHGPGDTPDAPTVSRAASGEAMRPLSPAHLKASLAADGSLIVSWVRRSRLAWAWLDDVEAPVDSAVHGFRLKAVGSNGTIERELAEGSVALSGPEVSSLGVGAIAIEVRQVGTLALSRPETITINV